MNLEKSLTYSEISRVIEILAIGLFAVFTIYTNSKQVPILAEKQQTLEIKVAVLSSQYSDIKADLSEIKAAVRHR